MQNFKLLEDVFLKTTYKIDEGGIQYMPGETIAKFDKIQIAGLQELVARTEAKGGYDNRGHVFWETTKEIDLAFSQGVFSQTQFALLSNSKISTIEQGNPIVLTKEEQKESNESGIVLLNEKPNDISKLFIYDISTGKKLPFQITENEKEFLIENGYNDVIVRYDYDYMGGGSNVQIGRRFISGYLSLEGKTSVKDDESGQVTTGLIKIPRLKLMSDLSIRLGNQANPVVANFVAKGIPTGERGNSYVSEFYFLNQDVTADL